MKETRTIPTGSSRLCQNLLLFCLLSGWRSSVCGTPATLAKGASFEVVAGKAVIGYRQYPIGTRVDAILLTNGQVRVTTEDGTTAVIPAAGVIYSPTPTPVPTVRPGTAAPRIADSDDDGVDLTTLSGKIYKQARVFRVEPDGINYMFAGGMVKIPFGDLPEAIRKQFDYDPKKASAFSAQDEADQRRLAAQAQAQTDAARRRQQAAESAQAAEDRAKAEHDKAIQPKQ